MSVYIVNNMRLHNRAEYETYLRQFMPVFSRFNGEVLAAADAPEPVEGQWPYDRTVILRFPTRAEALRWSQSPEYRAIAEHRWKGTTSNVVIIDGIGHREGT